MSVFVVPADQGACGLYRIIFPAGACMAAGYDVKISGALLRKALGRPRGDGTYEISYLPHIDADSVVIQRPASGKMLSVIEFLQKRGHKVVVELDDNIDALRPSNDAWKSYQSPDQNAAWTRRCVAAADRFVVSTPAIGAAYRRSDALVVENCIPGAYLEIGRKALDADISEGRRKVIGWSGSISVHRGDLRVVGSGLRDVLARNPEWSFNVVGKPEGVGEELNIGPVPKESSTGWMPMEDYIHALSGLSIGMAPIDDTPFNRSKSWLKSLEMASLGVPHVASDMPEYRRLGAALLASKPKFWRGTLTALVEDKDLRIERAEKGLHIAAENTYEVHASDFWAAWSGSGVDRRTIPS